MMAGFHAAQDLTSFLQASCVHAVRWVVSAHVEGGACWLSYHHCLETQTHVDQPLDYVQANPLALTCSSLVIMIAGTVRHVKLVNDWRILCSANQRVQAQVPFRPFWAALAFLGSR